jgi:cobalt transporter subunit CbtB
MQNQVSVTATPLAATISAGLHLAAAFVLGLVILYGVGFVSSPIVHNAAHDARHAQGFPCH